MKTQYRIIKPTNGKVTWRIQQETPVGWRTYSSPLIDKRLSVINSQFKTGALSMADAYKRMRQLLDDIYKDRDKEDPKFTIMPGNLTILDRFIKEKYPPVKIARMAPRSYESEVYKLQSAFQDIGHTPIEADQETLQEVIDTKYIDNYSKHKRRIASLNRVRLWLKLDKLWMPEPQEKLVIYATLDQVEEMAESITNPMTRLLVRVLFYSGMRTAEAFAILPQDLRPVGSSLSVHVSKQMDIKGNLVMRTKTRKSRKAFIIPGGEKYIKEWVSIPKQKVRAYRHSDHVKKAASRVGIEHFYVHCLRHSYCVHLITQGCSLDWVAKSAGHGRDVCERYYSSHVLADDSIILMARILTSEKAI